MIIIAIYLVANRIGSTKAPRRSVVWTHIEKVTRDIYVFFVKIFFCVEFIFGWKHNNIET
jgi:hypothetical protein